MRQHARKLTNWLAVRFHCLQAAQLQLLTRRRNPEPAIATETGDCQESQGHGRLRRAVWIYFIFFVRSRSVVACFDFTLTIVSWEQVKRTSSHNRINIQENHTPAEAKRSAQASAAAKETARRAAAKQGCCASQSRAGAGVEGRQHETRRGHGGSTSRTRAGGSRYRLSH